MTAPKIRRWKQHVSKTVQSKAIFIYFRLGVGKGWFTLAAAVCIFRSRLHQWRDRKIPISLQKCNCPLQNLHLCEWAFMGTPAQLKTFSHYCVWHVHLQQRIVFLQAERKNPISELMQSTAKYADRCILVWISLKLLIPFNGIFLWIEISIQLI